MALLLLIYEGLLLKPMDFLQDLLEAHLSILKLQLVFDGLASSPSFLLAILKLTAPSKDIDHRLAINFLFA